MWALGPGGFSCIVRFICFGPSAVSGLTALSNYIGIKGLGDEFFAMLPQGQDMLTGSMMIGTFGTFTFAWGIFQFIFSLFCHGILLALIGLIDLGIAWALTIGVSKQGRFVAHNNRLCDDAINWRNTTDGRNLFAILAETEKYENINMACNSFTLAWIMTIVVVMFYFIVAVVNLCIGINYVFGGSSETARFDFPEQIINRTANCILVPLSGCMLGIFTLLMWVFGPIFLVVAGGLSYLFGAVRFTFRLYVRMASARKTRVQQPPKQGSDPPSAAATLGEKTRSALGVKVLPFELVCSIAEDLHYTELLYASRASPTLRTTLFGVQDPDTRIEALREKTCVGQAKSSCETCGNQVCEICIVDIPTCPSHNIRHVWECKPHCSACFYKTRCIGFEKPEWPRYTSHQSSCYVLMSDVDAISKIAQGGHRSGHHRSKRMCRPCSDIPKLEKKAAAEERDRETAKRGIGIQNSCHMCHKGLSRGQLVWWMCLSCQAECPSDLHPLRWEWPTDADVV